MSIRCIINRPAIGALALAVLLAAWCPGVTDTAFAQTAPAELEAKIREQHTALAQSVQKLKQAQANERHVGDVEVFDKAADWILRHQEFYKPAYAEHTLKALAEGQRRAAALQKGPADWDAGPSGVVLAYRSAVDESVQPYAVSFPTGFGAGDPARRWPLHVVLHGRDGVLNEVSFIQAHQGRKPAAEQDWIQLDVFGRTNNAYRWSGETDVFEALADVRRRYHIDDLRIVLRGFSMGGAGAWHLGLHYPSQWCSVGPGAGFVDFYKFQKVAQPLPPHQHAALHIYDAIDYALNAFDVPICAYGGEKDPQLAAGTSMHAAARELQIDLQLLVGPNTGHQFHPESLKQYMAFHHERQVRGRTPYPGNDRLRFITWTPKYNRCEWLVIEELIEQYRPATVESERDATSGLLKLKTANVAVLQVARDLGPEIEIDGARVELANAADGLLPGVYYDQTDSGWNVRGYESSLQFSKNLDQRKRHNLQGPIDDAFMGPFVCVMPTGDPWSAEHARWADWTFKRFEQEFDKYLRGQPLVLKDTEVKSETSLNKNLVLFGDPGSNAVLAKIVSRLPIQWTREALVVNGQSYDPQKHGVALIFPNPLNPRRYVVLNSGHTFHEADFKNSNSWLFPRLGDIAVQKFEADDKKGFREQTVWADLFDSSWRLPHASRK